MHGIVKFHAVEQGKLVKAGLAKAVANGAILGRRSIMNDDLISEIKNLRKDNHSMRDIAKKCDVSTTIVQKALKL